MKLPIRERSNLLLDVLVALATSIAAGSRRGHTQGKDDKLKTQNGNRRQQDIALLIIRSFHLHNTFIDFSVNLTVFFQVSSFYIYIYYTYRGIPFNGLHLFYLDHGWSVVCCVLTVPLLAAAWLYIPTYSWKSAPSGRGLVVT